MWSKSGTFPRILWHPHLSYQIIYILYLWQCNPFVLNIKSTFNLVYTLISYTCWYAVVDLRNYVIRYIRYSILSEKHVYAFCCSTTFIRSSFDPSNPATTSFSICAHFRTFPTVGYGQSQSPPWCSVYRTLVSYRVYDVVNDWCCPCLVNVYKRVLFIYERS